MVWLCILCLFTYKSILVYLTCVGERFLWVHKHKHQLEIALKHADAKPFNQNWLYKHAKRLTDERHCQSCDFGCECMGLGKTYICWRVIVCSATDACFLCALALCDCRWVDVVAVDYRAALWQHTNWFGVMVFAMSCVRVHVAKPTVESHLYY